MVSAVKICRICGKEYTACRSANRRADVFRWQEVACSPECGAEYLKRVNESRQPKIESSAVLKNRFFHSIDSSATTNSEEKEENQSV